MQENYKLANELNKKIQGSFSNSYAPLGSMSINFYDSTAQHYERQLNLSTAISHITYEQNGVKYSRDYFVSAPAKILVIQLKASKAKALNFEVTIESLLQYAIKKQDNTPTLTISGRAPSHALPNYLGNVPNAILFDSSSMAFAGIVKIIKTDGAVISETGKLKVKNASLQNCVLLLKPVLSILKHSQNKTP